MSNLFDTNGNGSGRKTSFRRPIAWLGWLLLLLLLLVADPLDIHPVDTWLHHWLGHHEEHEGAGGQETQQLWTCGMHPSVIQEGPGACPICGMDLVPVRSDGGAAGETHAHAGEATALWTCPMHPEVVAEEPGDCPICGMDLVPVEAPEAEHAMQTRDDRPTVTIDPAVVQNMNVTTDRAARRDLRRTVRTVGYLDYDQEKMVSITTKYPGFIEKAYVNYLGQPVSRGEPLFEIYAPELVQTQQELLAALRYAERMQSAPDDARSRAAALVEAAHARLSYWDITDAQVERLQETGEVMRTLTVFAPAGGVVMKRMEGLEGMAVRPGMELLHIAGLASLWLRVEVFEDQLPWVDVGGRATVTFTYYPGEEFTGTVGFVEPSVSEKTRTLGLTLQVPNRDGRLRPGMYATVLFEPVAAADALTVPGNAVLRTGERDVVVVALGHGRFAPRDVKLGVAGGGYVQVLSGLDEGDRVVTSAQFLIDSESNLRAAIQKMLAARSGKAAAPAQGGGHVH